MSRELRRALLADHASRRVGFGAAPEGGAVSLRSPSCGDEVTVRIAVEDGRIRAVGWEGRGCEVSMASASILAATLPGTSADEMGAALERVSALVHGPEEVGDEEGGDDEGDGENCDLVALAGIGRYPLRAQCALLPWRAATSAAALSAG